MHVPHDGPPRDPPSASTPPAEASPPPPPPAPARAAIPDAQLSMLYSVQQAGFGRSSWVPMSNMTVTLDLAGDKVGGHERNAEHDGGVELGSPEPGLGG
jgi:hypothetical protein